MLITIITLITAQLIVKSPNHKLRAPVSVKSHSKNNEACYCLYVDRRAEEAMHWHP